MMQREIEAIGVRPDRHPSTQLFLNHQGRKPLFPTAVSGGENEKELDSGRPSTGRFGARTAIGDSTIRSLRRTKSTSESQGFPSGRRESNASALSSGGTRIPRLNSLSSLIRRPISLSEAYKMAAGEEEEIGMGHHPVDGSPSPAPRPWRTRTALDESKLRGILGEDHLDTKGQNKLPSNHNSNLSRTLVASKGTATSPTRSAGVPKAMGSARAAVRTTSNESVARTARFSSFGSSKLNDSDSGIPDLVPGIEDMPLPSVEPLPANVDKQSPEKSFAWEVDQDFTAGDLQVSDSPRVRTGVRPFANRWLYDDTGKLDVNSMPRLANPGSCNTKLDEIRSREVQAGSNLALLDRPRPRPPNTKLNEIRERETQVEHQFPIPNRHLDRLRNTKLDEIRQREVDGLSRRALAAARLEEIREQNSISRPQLAGEPRPQSSRELPRRSIYFMPDAVHEANSALPARPKTAFGEEDGRRIPDTPVTVFKRDPRHARDEAADELEKPDVEHQQPETGRCAQPDPNHRRYDDRELLRRLARAASSSPATAETKPQRLATPPPAGDQTMETKQITASKSEPGSLSARRASDNGRRATDGAIKDSAKSKPAVAFASLHQRTRSTESAKSKRSSMQSETDPTDRIEAEMKLFALMDNHSERGSTRAPSPPAGSDEEEKNKEEEQVADATPRPPKPDPLTMPTPRVTGAYVETPATVKVERRAEEGDAPSRSVEANRQAEMEPVKPEPPAPVLRDRRASLAWRNKDQDTASDPGAADESDVGIATSAAVRRPRARSLPRRRPPVKNSAKPPSVKDDILQLQRAYNIEDSTFDDLEDIISGRKAGTPKLRQLLRDLPARLQREDSSPGLDFKPDPPAAIVKKEKAGSSEPEASDGELALVKRMSKSLQTGLLGIRSAKQGIERLEGHFFQAKSKSAMDATPPGLQAEHDHDNHLSRKQGCPHCAAHPDPAAVTYLHLPFPRLFYRKPKFRLTWLGLFLSMFSLWFAAEWAMCSMYCRPTTCAASKAPCAWSFDDPMSFGTAIPIKLDHWATGGHGREALGYAMEEAHDWIADMQDLALGREMTAVDVKKLSFEQKRQHRRRLRKKGLAKPTREPTPEEKAKWDAWHQTRLARQRAREAREMGFVVGDDDNDDVEAATVGGDERVWS